MTISAATVHEAAGRVGALPSEIKPIVPGTSIWGRALPIRCAGGDNLALHHALHQASPGDVLVVDVGTHPEYGYWGEILSEAARARDISGLVINGGVRDCLALAEVEFPVFATRICIQGTKKNPAAGSRIGDPIRLGGVEVRRHDLVVGDADGVVVVPASRVEEVVRTATARDVTEAEFIARLRTGESTVDLYNLPPLRTVTVSAKSRRQQVVVSGLAHAGAPFPVAVRRGVVVASSAIHGRDPVTGVLPETVEGQAAGVFANIRRVIEAAGGRPEDIIKVVVFAANAASARSAVNTPWVQMFPDPDDRPVRHTLTTPLPAGFLVQAEFVAHLEENHR